MFIGFLVRVAIIWVVLSYVLGSERVHSFRPLVGTIFLASILTTILSISLGLIAIIPNIVVYTLAIVFFLKTDVKLTLLSVSIATGISLIFDLIFSSMY